MDTQLEIQAMELKEQLDLITFDFGRGISEAQILQSLKNVLYAINARAGEAEIAISELADKYIETMAKERNGEDQV